MTEAGVFAASRACGVIVALDFDQPADALALADRIDPVRAAMKVGLELYTRGGPQLVRDLVHRGHRVFLDLKFHDIPNTVASACRVARDLGVWMVDVHAGGGAAMLDAARTAIGSGHGVPLLIGVTVLTSMADAELPALGLPADAAAQVDRLAALAAAAGLDGVVCSGREAARLRAAHGEAWQLVCPGIRPAGAASGDQQRTLTPAEARAAGADWLVVGRPITRAADPMAALEAIEAELVAG
jgi:orotidine-5'-phosphate decarboxylase